MAIDYTSHYSTKKTPQNQAIPGKKQVKNSAGGYTFEVDCFARLDRFLILGSEGGSYYASENKLTVENADAVLRAIDQDGVRVVNRVVEISHAGRAPKNDPALFVLALAAKKGDLPTRKAAFAALNKVARIGTHLFTFVHFLKAFGGFGRLTKNALASWYTEKELSKVAYQVAKYQQRNGYSHADVIRLAHLKTEDAGLNTLIKWTGAPYAVDSAQGDIDIPGLEIIRGVELAKNAESAKQIVKLINDYNLPRECIPTQFLNDVEVWEALLQKMPLTAMVRNLGKMTSIGLVKDLSKNTKLITSRLRDSDVLIKARVHPIQILTAMMTYKQGHGVRGKLNWKPVTAVVDALDDAFYGSFGNVTPTGKNIMLALDVSGSMGFDEIAGCPGLTPRVGSAALALITAATESNYVVRTFSSNSRYAMYTGASDVMGELNISPKMRLDDVVRKVSNLPFGGTDCALPMLMASKEKLDVDAFVVYTDSETWAGNIHPCQALNDYRRSFVNDARLIVVGMVSNGFTIADPKDAGMLDVVGFDTATPNIMSDFIRGDL